MKMSTDKRRTCNRTEVFLLQKRFINTITGWKSATCLKPFFRNEEAIKTWTDYYILFMVYLSEDKWRRLVKNSRCANQNIGWGQRVVKRDKYVGVSQLLWGTCSGCPPKVYAYGEDDTNTLRDVFIHVCDPKKDDNYELVKSCYPFNYKL